jgi:tetratricopeptide (TPR) repeat protein/predicted Ser/Thr protein kinase
VGCLDADTLAALFAGALTVEERERAEAHADECDTCRGCIAALARGQAAPGETVDSTASPELDRQRGRHRVLDAGRSISRYVVGELLGAGAMGAVYAAHDPQLDRSIALKIVGGMGDPNDGAMRARRLVREAQAMARLSHPNVIPVYDSGQDGDVVFIAMKRIDGVPLGRWLDDRPPRREVLRAMAEAGRGLAAAHDAGIVHRDFKPDNVLVDRRGVTQVGDFGLAMVDGGPSEDTAGEPGEPGEPGSRATAPARPAASSASTWRTADGAILGTPAYMAPEVWTGARADARSDQYSFAVTLHEALTGLRPLSGAASVTGRLPRRIRRALVRGLSRDPSARFPSMTELVAALEPRRVTRAVVVAAASAALVAGTAAWFSRSEADPVAACDQVASSRLAAVWSARQRGEVDTHVRGLPGRDGPRTAAATVGRIDAYTGRWLDARREACRATSERGEQSAELFDLRMRCLDERLDEVEVVRSSLLKMAPAELPAAAYVPDILGELAQCDDPTALRSRAAGITDAASARKARDLRARLADARAFLPRGDFDQAERRSDAVVTEARAAKLPIVEAEALLTRSQVRGMARREGVAEGFHQALAIAEKIGDGATRVDALSGILTDAAVDPARAGEVELLVKLIETALAELPGDQSLRRARMSANLVNYYEGRQDFATAEARAAQAYRYFRAEYGPAADWSIMLRQSQARLLTTQGRYAAAIAIHAEILGTVRAVYGEDHPMVGDSLIAQGVTLAHAQRRAEGLKAFQDALGVFERAQGPDHPMVAEALRKIGFMAVDDEPAVALPAFTRAVAIVEKNSGAEALELTPLLTGLGQAQLSTGDAAGAVKTLERALRIWGERQNYRHLLPSAHFALARALWETGGDKARARALAEKARQAFLDNKGPWLPLASEVAAWQKSHP